MQILKQLGELTVKAFGIAIVVAAVIFGVSYISYHVGVEDGRREMHNELCDDMRAENEAPLLMTNKYGRMYTYSYDDSYDEYQTKRSRK